jgi:hypothetical protein
MESSYRLLAYDLDGTFLDASGRLPDEAAVFLRTLQDSGVQAVAATGRRLHSALPHLREAGLTGRCVVQNGALVASVPDGEVLRQQCLTALAVGRVLQSLESASLVPVLYTNAPAGPGEIYFPAGADDPTGYLAWYREYAKGHFTEVTSWEEAPQHQVARITAYQEHSTVLGVREQLQRGLGSEVRTLVTLDPGRQTHRLEVMHPRASKWGGISWLAERWNLTPEQVVSVGDDANDVDMLRGAGRSFSSQGATPVAREAAQESIEEAGPQGVVRRLWQVFDLMPPRR